MLFLLYKNDKLLGFVRMLGENIFKSTISKLFSSLALECIFSITDHIYCFTKIGSHKNRHLDHCILFYAITDILLLPYNFPTVDSANLKYLFMPTRQFRKRNSTNSLIFEIKYQMAFKTATNICMFLF